MHEARMLVAEIQWGDSKKEKEMKPALTADQIVRTGLRRGWIKYPGATSNEELISRAKMIGWIRPPKESPLTQGQINTIKTKKSKENAKTKSQ